VAVGKPRDRAIDERVADYGARIARFGVAWESIAVRGTAPGRRYSDDHVRERDARELLDACHGPGTVVALDPHGRPWTSEQIAQRIERWATPRASILVGGPLGLAPEVIDRADAVWSLSPLTFPHELVRLLVAEQIYRAWTIVRKVPYHKA